MTIVCAYKVTDAVWIGCDGLMISHGRKVVTDANKWLDINGLWVGMAGYLRARTLLQSHANEGALNLANARTVLDKVRELIKADGWTPTKQEDGGPEDYPIDLLIVDREKKVWVCHGDGGLAEITSGFAAIGSGSQYAFGAWCVLTKNSMKINGGIGWTAGTVLMDSIAAACTYDPDCGGDVKMWRLDCRA